MKLRTSILPLLFLWALSISSCASFHGAGREKTVAPLKMLKFTVNYYHTDNSILSGPKGKELLVQMSAFQGKLFGNANTDNSIALILNDTEKVEKDVKELEGYISKYAKPLDRTYDKTNVVITPASARFVRLGTRAYYSGEPKPIGATGFVNNDTGNGVFLVYFYEPCEIVGSLKIGGDKYDHKIKIDTAGTYWISALKMQQNTFVLTEIQQNEAISLAIYPRE